MFMIRRASGLGSAAPLVLGLVAACALTACQAPSEATETGEPPIGPILTVRSDADIVLPMDGYRPTAQRVRLVTSAVNILGRECMKRLGLDWPANQATAPASPPRNARRYSIVDAEKAATDGYHAVEQSRARRTVQAQRKNQPVPSRDALNVWVGRGQTIYNGQSVPPGGCAAEATRQLTGGVAPASPELAEKLQLESFGRTRSDSRVVRAFAAWSACMKEQGFHYPDPFAAIDDHRWQASEISKQEITTAVADVACKSRTAVAGTMLAVERAYQQRLIDKHADELNAIKASFDTQVTAASQVMATGGR
jgi:hypothetical protein